ncbi:hypothetical protein EMEDMD4_1240009 [Sinorhizobium medicae]|uniref:Uncharacterized protein n=1 Tax=Sinorhizobium medicae TaxID=110321 RepID=A0A508WVW5_9HYPH|nr:hypothetical protein EMEDMD4_1240009 [Sinorhizobium medicae]
MHITSIGIEPTPYAAASWGFIDIDLRLRMHVKQNILFYMQAIWNHEPPDQRFFRLRAPRQFHFIPFAGLFTASKPGDPAHLSLSQAPTTTIMAREDSSRRPRTHVRATIFVAERFVSGAHRRRSAMRPAERVKIIDALQLSQQSFSWRHLLPPYCLDGSIFK